MIRDQFILPLYQELIADGFAGGGGMSSAIEHALGRHVDIAFNHNENAISMHWKNHPQTRHYIADVYEIDPRAATHGIPVGLFHISPDCTHHSQAASGQPRDRKTRALSWVALKWAGQVAPRGITLENVFAILKWGPLIAKRDKATGRVVKIDSSVAAPGERVSLDEQFLVPDPKRAGQTWKRFVTLLRGMGYVVEWDNLVASLYGAPTSRDRLFMVARRDGVPITWPAATHAKIPGPGQLPLRTTAECIDWSLSGKSIFYGRSKALADATMRRLAKGVHKEVLGKMPYIVPGVHSLAHGQAANDAAAEPIKAAFLAHFRGNCDSRSLREPLMTISAGGNHHGLVECTLLPMSEQHEPGALRVAAFLMHYYSEGGQWGDLRQPLATITTRDRIALVTVYFKGELHVIVDIQLRMLTPRELYNAQGFQPNYIIDRGHDGRVFTKAQQVHMCGNSVSRHPAQALIRVNFPELAAWHQLDKAA